MEGKVCKVEMESGEAGYCVKCYCDEKKLGGGMYDMPMRKEYEFNFSESDSEEAFKKFLELDKMKKEKGED